MRPDLPELRRVLTDLRGATRPDRGLDASTLLALGWEVRRGAEARHPRAWRMRSPLSRLWQPVPLLTRDPLGCFAFLPPAWEWAVGHGQRRRGWALANNGEPQSLGAGGVAPNPKRIGFEVDAPTPGLAALIVTLMSILALAERAERACIQEAA